MNARPRKRRQNARRKGTLKELSFVKIKCSTAASYNVKSGGRILMGLVALLPGCHGAGMQASLPVPAPGASRALAPSTLFQRPHAAQRERPSLALAFLLQEI